MSDSTAQQPLAGWRAKYPELFRLCDAAQEAAADPWGAALQGAEGRDKVLLVELRRALDESSGAARLHLDGPAPRLEFDPAWAAAHGETVVDITAMVYGPGAGAVRRWLLGGGEDAEG